MCQAPSLESLPLPHQGDIIYPFFRPGDEPQRGSHSQKSGVIRLENRLHVTPNPPGHPRRRDWPGKRQARRLVATQALAQALADRAKSTPPACQSRSPGSRRPCRVFAEEALARGMRRRELSGHLCPVPAHGQGRPDPSGKGSFGKRESVCRGRWAISRGREADGSQQG